MNFVHMCCMLNADGLKKLLASTINLEPYVYEISEDAQDK